MFGHVSPPPLDPILRCLQEYRQDTRSYKIDMSVGIYLDASGNSPIMNAVQEAQKNILSSQTTKAYVGPLGNEGYNQAIQTLFLKKDHDANDRACTLQTPGGTSALRSLADMFKYTLPEHQVWVSNPTWANHVPIFSEAGFKVQTYPYLDENSRMPKEDAMLGKLETLGKKDIVVLHGCCHNPSGADISQKCWQRIAEIAEKNGFTPLIDYAYLGLGENLEKDAYGLLAISSKVENFFIASSCSKNFGLYRERVGAAIMVSKNKKISAILRDLVANVIARKSYSMPPDFGASIVEEILSNPTLTQSWQQELTQMQQRINSLRKQIVTQLNILGSSRWDFIKEHKGLFSLLPISENEASRLMKEHAIYALSSGRINIAGLRNESQVDRFAKALIDVTQQKL